ncbi:MAG: ribose 5-phosphate isomerase A, partial [Infirmifilum sp.]
MEKNTSDVALARMRAVEAALELVRDGMLIGLGSGTTLRLFIEKLAERVKQEGLEVHFVSTSHDTSFLAARLGLVERPLLDEKPEIAFDGADYIFPERWVVKGMGAALFREKIVDYFSKEYVILADWKKLRDQPLNVPVPVEVHPFAAHQVLSALLELPEAGQASIRQAEKGKLGPVVTDNGNFLVDVVFKRIENPQELELKLTAIPGVTASGIFAVKKPSKIFLGYPDNILTL